MEPDDDVQALLEEAEEALERGDVDHALGLLEGPAEETDADPEVRAMFGLALYYADNFEDAYEYLVEAVDRDSEDFECRGALGVCEFFRLELVAAEKNLRRAVASAPDWADAHYWLARVVEFRGRYPEAMTGFQAAHRLDREHYPVPVRLRDDEIDSVVGEAIDALPTRIRTALEEVPIQVDEYPTLEMLTDADPPFPPDILGLFTGPSRLDEGAGTSGSTPPIIHIFRRNLEHWVGSREEVVDEIRVTLLHEIGHYLGMDEDELHRLGLE